MLSSYFDNMAKGGGQEGNEVGVRKELSHTHKYNFIQKYIRKYVL